MHKQAIVLVAHKNSWGYWAFELGGVAWPSIILPMELSFEKYNFQWSNNQVWSAVMLGNNVGRTVCWIDTDCFNYSDGQNGLFQFEKEPPISDTPKPQDVGPHPHTTNTYVALPVH